jgi:hypothetical protein
MPRVSSHATRLAPRWFYSVTPCGAADSRASGAMELLRQCVHWHASARFSWEHLSRTASEYRAGHASPLTRANRRGLRSADISTRGFANRRNGLIVIYSSLRSSV